MTVVKVSIEGVALVAGRGLAQLGKLLEPDSALGFFRYATGLELPDNFLTAKGLTAPIAQVVSAANPLASLSDSLEAASGAEVIAAGATLIAKIAEVLAKLAALRSALSSVSAPAGVPAARLSAFANELPLFVGKFALIEFFRTQVRGLFPTLTLLGLVDDVHIGPSTEAGGTVRAHVRREFHGERLFKLLSDPQAYLSGVLGWGASPLVFEPGQPLFDRLEAILRYIGFPLQRVRAGGELSLESDKLSLRRTSPSSPGLTLDLGVSVPGGIDFTGNFKPGLDVRLSTTGEIAFGSSLTLTPPATLSLVPPSGSVATDVQVEAILTPTTSPSFLLLGIAEASRLEAGAVRAGFGATFGWNGSSAQGSAFATFGLDNAKAVLDLTSGDGLLKSLLPTGRFEAGFTVQARYDGERGLSFSAGGALEVELPLHVTFGPLSIKGLTISLPLGTSADGLPLDFSTNVGVNFGPFTLTIDGVGLTTVLSLPESGGNIGGFADFQAGILLPSGIGVAIDGGGISGGGFLAHDAQTGRYSGAIELRVFSLGLKAFGVLDTRFPDGTEGMSFVVIIIAEFTPIQLGFGFTLNGVGGLLGVNRTVAEQALGDAVRAGSLEHLLFPVNVVADAPAIINDLATVFPATKGHQIFGPMAKFGWGTPTLISGEIGIIIEFPGPRLALLGVIRMQLPSAQFAVLNLNLAIVGLLDFPAQKFSIDASLFDSYVAGFGVSGDMAYRMEFGSKPSFLLSVGGFNPGFHPPPQYPTLRRASADLGLNGNPSLTASGYFALTSNTAQFGASLELRAKGFGIRLRGGFAIDVLFVFSPFSFSASFSAGVHVDFHGFGIGVSLHGNLSGPTPWHFNGKACVEVCIWDACLPVDIKFGRDEPASLPELDPWDGTDLLPDTDPRVAVRGLNLAIQDPRSWEGEAPPEGFSVVSLAAAASADRTPIDPLGAALLRQKVCPLNQELERFGTYKPTGHTHFGVSAVTLGTRTLDNYDFVEDQFAPASFMNLSNAQKLSASSYDRMIGGVRLAPSAVASGPSTTQTLEYETVFITADGQRIEEGTGDPRYSPTQPELRGMLSRSSAGRAGIRRMGAQKYMLAGRPKLLTLDDPTFVVADACSRTQNTAITPIETTHTQALLALRQHEQANPADRNRFRVLPFFAAA